MNKKIKSYLLIIMAIMTFASAIPAFAEGEAANPTPPASAQATAVQPTANTVQTQPSVPADIQTKQPISKRQLAMKFLIAMLGVGLSSVIIFVLLSSYNKFVYGSYTRVEPSEEDNSYKTPTNMKDAINTFLKKTK